MDDLGKYTGKSPVCMWTSGAVDMWITVAVQSPCQAPGLSLTPPGDIRPPECAGPGDPAPPGCAVPVSGTEPADGQDRTGRPQMRPIWAVRMSRGPGPQRSRGTAGCRTALRPSGPPGGRSRVPRSEGRAGGGPGAAGGRIGPRGDGPGPPGPRTGRRPRSARMPHGTKPDCQRRPKPRSRRQRTPAPGLRPGPGPRRLSYSVARADRDQTAGQAGPGQPTGPTRRRRSPGNVATSNYQRRTSRSGRPA